MFQSRQHKANYLLKENREIMEKVVSLMREIADNEREIVRLYSEVEESNKPLV